MSFDLKLDALMRRKRDLSRGLLLPGEDDGDTASLFDDVLGAGAQPEETANPAAGFPDPPPVKSTGDDPPPRQTLSLRPALRTETPLPEWPTRMVFQPKVRRNLDIFEKPVAGQSLTSLAIRDPYGCADGTNRQCLIDFMTIVVGAVRQLGGITVVSFDADSVDRYAAESSVQKYDDLQARWKPEPELSRPFDQGADGHGARDHLGCFERDRRRDASRQGMHRSCYRDVRNRKGSV